MQNAIIEKLSRDTSRLKDNWCMPLEACKLLYLLARTFGAKHMLELGTSIGYSTLWLAEAAKANSGTVETIDYFEDRQDEAKNNIDAACLTAYVEFHQGQALDCIQRFSETGKKFDFIFIDASKAEYIKYFKQLTPMLITGGLFIADNTQSHREQMLDFIEAITTSIEYDSADIDTPNGLIIARKK